MIATETHRVTMPKRISTVLSRRAKADNVSFSQAFTAMMEAAIEYAEEGHIWDEALERKLNPSGFVSHADAWK